MLSWTVSSDVKRNFQINWILSVESADNLEAQILNEVQLSGLYRLFYNFEGEEDAGFFKDEFEGRIESLHNKRIIANTVFVAGGKWK